MTKNLGTCYQSMSTSTRKPITFMSNRQIPPTSQPDHKTIVSLLVQALEQGQSPKLTVISNSMAPLLNRGDQVTLSKLNFETLKKGDIITLTQREALTTHRVVTVTSKEIVTKGDCNFILDEPINLNQVIGKVSLITPQQSNTPINLDARKNQTKLNWIYYLSRVQHVINVKTRNKFRAVSVTFKALRRLILKTI